MTGSAQPSDDPFIRSLVGTLAADPDVIGLVLAGSSAETARRDQWSDHDFLVITEDGTPERYRTHLEWLPDPDGIAYWFRETPHGLKVLYRNGLMVEFAVFDRAEFAGCALNHYSVVIDRGGIADVAAGVRGRSLAPRSVDRLVEFRTMLSLLYLGTGRARRGELLSANVLVRDYAVGHLLRLVRDLLPPEQAVRLDDLDVWRRFESADPDLAREIDASLALPVEQAARSLLDVSDRWLPTHWPQYPRADTEVVRGLLGW